MSRRRPWIALFSHSGKEIYQISTAIARKPTMVLTTNLDANTWFPKLLYGYKVGIPYDDKMHDVFSTLRQEDWKDALITLHGYMKIIPKDLCESRDIWNGHPALINMYEELRGKDPQEKTWENIASYPFVGSVVHKVTAEVDDTSTILHYCMVNNTCNSKEDLYNTLRRTSLVSWLQFFDEMKGQL